MVISLVLGSILPLKAATVTTEGTDNVTTINAKLDRGDGVNQFKFFPEDKWKFNGVADEVFTTVDTTAAGNQDCYYEITFDGTGIEVWGVKAPAHPIISFSIDGGTPQEIDTWAGSRALSKLVEFKGLDDGQHVLKAQATGRKNPSATGGAIQVTEAKIYKPIGEATDVRFLDKEVTIYLDETYQVKYECEPANSKLPYDFEFTSSDETVATVDETGLVTPVSTGTVIIDGTCQGLGVFLSMKVNIEEKGRIHATIVDSDDQYVQDQYNDLFKQNIKEESLWTWKKDKAISEIAVLAHNGDLTNVTVEIGEFTNEHGTVLAEDLIKATQIKEATGFIGNAGYSLNNTAGVMPVGPRGNYFDILYSQEPFTIPDNTFSLIWLDFYASADTEGGVYTGTISITADGLTEKQVIDYSFEVLEVEFSDTEHYTFRPDYWTYPFSTAEYYDVEPFSDEHMAILKDHLLQYKSYGGTAITGTLMEDVWGGQTYGKTDPANGDTVRTPSLIKWTKKTDGSMEFDYTYFDKFVEVAKSAGVGNDIVMHSPMPWNNRVMFYDESQGGKLVSQIVNPANKQQYSAFWKPFFEDFRDHLDEKGWFDDISFGFDERPNMKTSFDVIDEVTNKDGHLFKKQGAYNHIYNGDGVPDRMVNISYNLNQARTTGLDQFKRFAADRAAKGFKTTTYTGTDVFPNSFLLSIPAESYWTMMFSGSCKLDGFLDWAYDAWVEDPLRDITHFAFQAGDVFMVYPSERDAANKVTLPSIRSEKYDEGVRDINKLYIMRENSPELAGEIDALFGTVKANYPFNTVNNGAGWCAGIANNGRPAKWITEAGRATILSDVDVFKQKVYEISKKYEELMIIPVDTITLDPDQVSLKVGETHQINATVLPADATNKALVYTSQEADIASVDSQGIVTAVRKGTIEIVVSTRDGSVSTTLKVTVTEEEEPGEEPKPEEPGEEPKPEEPGGEPKPGEPGEEPKPGEPGEEPKPGEPGEEPKPDVPVQGITLVMDIQVGGIYKINAMVTPADATDKTLVYTSKNPDIVSVDDAGNVKALRIGTAEIEITNPKYQVRTAFTVNVTESGTSDGVTLPGNGGGGSTANRTNGTKKISTPGTGDFTNLGALMAAMGISGSCILASLVASKRKSR